MSLLVPSKSPIGEFTYREGSHLTTRPGTTGFGTAITPGNNTYGTALQIGADTVEECWGILIGVNNINASTLAKDSLTQIGFDFTGGTTFPATPDRFNSIELLTSCASTYGTAGSGLAFYFPIYLPAGTAIMARGSVNNATVGTQNVWWQLYGRPKNPEVARRGQFVQALGITAASSSGTAVTPGGAAEGTAVSVGLLTDDSWYWEWGVGQNDADMQPAVLHSDILIGSSTGPVIVENLPHTLGGQEAITKPASLAWAPVASVPAGTEIFARMQNSTTNDTAYSVAVYAVGG